MGWIRLFFISPERFYAGEEDYMRDKARPQLMILSLVTYAVCFRVKLSSLAWPSSQTGYFVVLQSLRFVFGGLIVGLWILELWEFPSSEEVLFEYCSVALRF
jgi:hypothetical protein